MPTTPPARTLPVFRWATSIDAEPETSPLELTALGEHIDRCNGSRGAMFRLRCAADSLSGFLAPRLITTLAAVAIVLVVGSLIV